MTEYTLADIFEDTVIELNGNKFKLRQRTKALGTKLDGLEKTLGDLGDDVAEDEVVGMWIDFLDVILEPLGDGNNGTRTHAKTVLKKAWDQNNIGGDRIIGLANFCRDKMTATLDPTQSLTSIDV